MRHVNRESKGAISRLQFKLHPHAAMLDTQMAGNVSLYDFEQRNVRNNAVKQGCA